MLFEADELAELRADIKEVMDDVAGELFTNYRGSTRVRSATSPEQYTVTPTAVLTDYPCSYRLTNAQERFLAALESSANLWTVTVPAGIDIEDGDDLTIKAKGGEAAKPLLVKTILKTSNALRWRVICVDK